MSRKDSSADMCVSVARVLFKSVHLMTYQAHRRNLFQATDHDWQHQASRAKIERGLGVSNWI
jgi:hypothetical protein